MTDTEICCWHQILNKRMYICDAAEVKKIFCKHIAFHCLIECRHIVIYFKDNGTACQACSWLRVVFATALEWEDMANSCLPVCSV